MNIYEHTQKIIFKVISDLFPKIENVEFVVEQPKDESHGDLATNAAMIIFGKYKNELEENNPRAVAEKIKSLLEKNDSFKKIEIAGPGFINIIFTYSFWHSFLEKVLEKKEDYGKNKSLKNIKTNIEYVSANPTGPMHIGHVRGAIVGDVIANLLESSGADICREFYINDAGAQVNVLIKSVYLRYLEALGENIGKISQGLYPGEYLKPLGEELAKKYKDSLKEKSEEEREKIIRDFSLKEMMQLIKKDLRNLGVHHDVFTSEQDLADQGITDQAFEDLKTKNYVYEGVLPPPKGKEMEDWEATELTLFKSTEFGDDVDRAMKKRDGSWTYFAPDVGYHYNKFKRGFDWMILELGSDHGGYVKRLKAAVSALSEKKAKLDTVLHQLVKLIDNGVEVKMSKRSGTFYTANDLVEEIGKDATRFMMLTRKSDVTLDFDIQKTLEFTNENPVFYVQYASARMHSVLRKVAELKIDINDNKVDLSFLKEKEEIDLIKEMAKWPETIKIATKYLEPHRITFYLLDLAAKFHHLWNADHKFIQEDKESITLARIALIKACLYTLKSGLNILSVDAVKKM